MCRILVLGRMARSVLEDVVGIDEGSFDPQPGQPLREELGDAAIDIALGHDMVAGLDQRQYRRGDRGHARRKQQCRIGAFEFGDGVFGDGTGGIAVAGVEAVGRSGADLLLQVGDFEGRSLIDRRDERPVLFGEADAAADGLGFLAELMLLH
jgi:hypothetical protein